MFDRTGRRRGRAQWTPWIWARGDDAIYSRFVQIQQIANIHMEFDAEQGVMVMSFTVTYVRPDAVGEAVRLFEARLRVVIAECQFRNGLARRHWGPYSR